MGLAQSSIERSGNEGSSGASGTGVDQASDTGDIATCTRTSSTEDRSERDSEHDSEDDGGESSDESASDGGSEDDGGSTDAIKLLNPALLLCWCFQFFLLFSF